MPKHCIDYAKTIMYMILCKNCLVLEFYIGQTTNFIMRKSGHKTCSKTSQNKFYKCIRENGGWSNWTMVKIEDFPCRSSQDAIKRETELIQQHRATLNTNQTKYPPKNHQTYTYNWFSPYVSREKIHDPHFQEWMKMTSWIRNILL